jgi:hypothetical protein
MELQRAGRSFVNQLGDLVAVAVALFEQREDQDFGAAFAQLAVVGHMWAAYVSVTHMSTPAARLKPRVPSPSGRWGPAS